MIYAAAEDSYLLEEEVRKRAEGRRVLDVGCGSGIQMEAALDSGAKEVFGVDISDESIEFCRGAGLNVEKSDLFSEVEGKFDLIVFNPPYLPKDSREDVESGVATSGGVKGDEIIVRFLKDVGGFLEDDGRVLIVVSSLTPVGEIDRVLREKKMERKVVASESLFMEKLAVWEIQRRYSAYSL